MRRLRVGRKVDPRPSGSDPRLQQTTRAGPVSTHTFLPSFLPRSSLHLWGGKARFIDAAASRLLGRADFGGLRAAARRLFIVVASRRPRGRQLPPAPVNCLREPGSKLILRGRLLREDSPPFSLSRFILFADNASSDHNDKPHSFFFEALSHSFHAYFF